jgi:hypothetical protein
LPTVQSNVYEHYVRYFIAHDSFAPPRADDLGTRVANNIHILQLLSRVPDTPYVFGTSSFATSEQVQ